MHRQLNLAKASNWNLHSGAVVGWWVWGRGLVGKWVGVGLTGGDGGVREGDGRGDGGIE